MAIIVSPPEIVGFSKDVILWRFEDDRAGIIPGIAAEAWFTVGNPVQEGTQIIFRWGDNELRFTARETIGEYGNEIPIFPVYSIEAHEAYIKSLVPYFQDNLFLDRDFIIAADFGTISGPFGSVDIWYVKFTARSAGSRFTLSDTVFNGGGINPVVPGKDDSTVANNGVYVEVWMQTPDGSMFQKKYEGVQPFDSTSIASFDVASVLHSNLASEIPDMVLPIAERCTQSRRKYYLRYALYGGETPSIGPVQLTSESVVLLGGFAQWTQGPQSVIDTFRISDRESKILQLQTSLRVIRVDEPVFVSWLNLAAAPRNVYARATLKLADGTELTTNTGVVTAVQQYEKLVFAVGYKQLNLFILEGQGKVISEYTVQICDDLGVISDGLRLVVDYRHLEHVRYFAHVNSYGCIHTLMTSGKGSSTWKIFKETAQKVLPYTFDSREAQFVEWNATFRDVREVATGWMLEKNLILWLDLFISALKYRVIDGRAYAIQINSDTIERGTDGDNLYALVFEYQFARILDSINEELLEGEDVSDYIPPNIIVAGSQTSGGGNVPAPPPGNIYVDPYPISGSRNPVSSDGMFRALELFQKKLPVGNSEQYLNGEGKLRNMRQAVNSNEADPTVPPYAKSLTGLSIIVNGLQALPIETGLNVQRFGGQIAEWYIRRMSHPSFSKVPPIVVELGVPFEKYIDLTIYKTSYHPNADLTLEILFNTDKLAGVVVTADGLQLTLKGTLNEIISERDNVLLTVRDPNQNQTTVALRITTIEDEPEVPDNRPVCAKGPFHWLQTPIETYDNSSFLAPYDANGVNPIAWVISLTKNAETPLRAGQAPPFNGPFIKPTFDPIPGGTYWLGISGVLCKSPWEWREITFPVATTLDWSEGYPKYNSHESFSEFLAMVDQSGRFLTELLNLNTNTKVYSVEHDYVADTTEIQIWNGPGWPAANYRLNVGPLSKNITVGTPPAPPEIFKLVNGWDGSTIADLTAGPYQGPLPGNGFNGYFEDPDTGVAYRLFKAMLEKKVSGDWVHVTSVGGSGVSQTPATMVLPYRLISVPGVDSRSISFQGQSLNQAGEYRFSVFLYEGTTEASPLVKTYQQTFQFSRLEIKGGVVSTGAPGARIFPALGRVQFNGVNVVNNNVWVAPFANFDNLQFNVNGGTTWYSTSAWFNMTGTNDVSNVVLMNGGDVDLFPPGQPRTVRLRVTSKPSIISGPYVVDFSGSVGGVLTPKTVASGYPVHMKLVKTEVPGGWNITDESGTTPPPGYHNLYIMNRELNAMPGSLTDYFYDNDMPLGVYKIQRKNGVTDLYFWHGNGPDADETIAQAFSDNSSIAFEMIIFNKK